MLYILIFFECVTHQKNWKITKFVFCLKIYFICVVFLEFTHTHIYKYGGTAKFQLQANMFLLFAPPFFTIYFVIYFSFRCSKAYVKLFQFWKWDASWHYKIFTENQGKYLYIWIYLYTYLSTTDLYISMCTFMYICNPVVYPCTWRKNI